MTPPRTFSALPPSGSHEASPKAISGRTSYLRVRLEFLPYPHLIATLFNGCACGPPKPFTAPSSWTWIDHPVSGLRPLTPRPLKTWFPCGCPPCGVSPRQRSQLAGPFYKKYAVALIAYSAPAGRGHRVSGSLSLPSRGPFHLSLTVLDFPQGFPCLVVLRIPLVRSCFRVRGSHPLWPALPRPFH